jgi:hypothetical protein
MGNRKQPTPPPTNQVKPPPPPAPPRPVLTNFGAAVIALEIGPAGVRALRDVLEFMQRLTPDQRVTVQQAISDYFCPRCGIEQPEGDCHCG